MKNTVKALVIVALLAWSAAAPAQGPYGALVVRNQTDATMDILRDRQLDVVIKVPPHTVLVLEGFLSQGRHEVQVLASCVQGVEPYSETFWVSGDASESNVLVITADRFGKSLLFDKPNCGVALEAADSYGHCVEYAQKALSQNRLGQENECRFTGDLWDDSLSVHISWCLYATPEEILAKDEARTKALADCQANKGKRPWCLEYAVEAADQTTAANVLGCSFSGELWNADRGVHYDYCMAVDRQQCQEATASRAKAIEDCQAEIKADLFCRNYAATGVEQQKSNLSMNCGFEGGGWTENYDEHYDFCLRSSEEFANKHSGTRQGMLKGCAEKSEQQEAESVAKEDRCVAYAERAVGQYRESHALGCGFSGGRWSNDYQAHYDWCLGASRQATDNEDKARMDGLGDCRAKMSRKGFCEQYASTAVDQFHQSQGMGCGFGGDRWSDDYQGHYNWCLGVSDQQAQGETTARENGLIQCSQRDQ